MFRGARRLNPGWSLNTGLVMRLVPTPGGAIRWYDLVTGTPYYLQTWTTGARPAPMPGGKMGLGIRSDGSQAGSLLSSVVPHPRLSTAYTNWSAAIWYYDQESSAAYPVLLANNNNDAIIQILRSGSNIEFRSYLGLSTRTYSTTAFSPGKLVRLVITGDGTNTRAYVNGRLVGTQAFSGTVRPPSRIGNYTTPGGVYTPIGYMADACFWGRTLGETGIMADYLDGLAGFPQAFTGLTLPSVLPAAPAAVSGLLPGSISVAHSLGLGI